MKRIVLSFMLSACFINNANAQGVGIGTTTPNAKAALDISSTTRGLLPPRMDSTQRKAITSPPAGLVIYNTSIKSFECYNGTAWYSTVHFIGEAYGGGIVFFVYDNGQHGLIATKSDQSTGVQWYNNIAVLAGTKGNGLGQGAFNTTLIIAAYLANNVNGIFAANVCADYSVTEGGITYGDWYLPSNYELKLLYQQRAVVGNFGGDFYWSSTESSAISAIYLNFINGFDGFGNKPNQLYVRAVRAF